MYSKQSNFYYQYCEYETPITINFSYKSLGVSPEVSNILLFEECGLLGYKVYSSECFGETHSPSSGLKSKLSMKPAESSTMMIEALCSFELSQNHIALQPKKSYSSWSVQCKPQIQQLLSHQFLKPTRKKKS
jgi:hypothetical protein